MEEYDISGPDCLREIAVELDASTALWEDNGILGQESRGGVAFTNLVPIYCSSLSKRTVHNPSQQSPVFFSKHRGSSPQEGHTFPRIRNLG